MTIEVPKRLEELPTSDVRWIGHRVHRREDAALLTGKVKFIADVELPGMLHAAILRSPSAHARITSIDVTAAKDMAGVAAVVTGEDALAWTNPARSAPEGWGARCLASQEVHFVGEPVAAVAAASRYLAEDALELIEVDYEPLEAVVDPFTATDPSSPTASVDHDTNVMMHRVFTWGDVDGTFASATQVFTEKFRWNRVGANPMETYGAICQWDP